MPAANFLTFESSNDLDLDPEEEVPLYIHIYMLYRIQAKGQAC